MGKFEILWELPKCDTDTKRARKMVPTDLLAAGLAQAFSLLKKHSICEVQ